MRLSKAIFIFIEGYLQAMKQVLTVFKIIDRLEKSNLTMRSLPILKKSLVFSTQRLQNTHQKFLEENNIYQRCF